MMVAAALWATVRLIDDLIHGSAVTNDPARLLATGALVWLGNNLSFSLLYWLIDSGGPIMRARQPLPADFAFTQHMSPELARARLAACVPRLSTPGFHERDRIQPNRRDATDPPRQVHNARAVVGCPRVVRSHRGPSRKRLHLTRNDE